MEVMAGASDDLEAPTRAFLKGFDVIALDEMVAERAVKVFVGIAALSFRMRYLGYTARKRDASRHPQHQGFWSR
jgi:hypothetical protein